MLDAKHFYVSGYVQGVYYRATTQQKAAALGLNGWVRNLPDGRVEVLASGETAVLNKLEQWLWQGPDDALVDDVVSIPADLADMIGVKGFQVKR